MAIEQRTATGTLVEESSAVVETGKLVGFWRRWTALLVDELILVLIVVGLAQAFFHDYVFLDFSDPNAAKYLLSAVGFGVIYTFGFLLLNQGQTVGMQLAGIQLKRENGKPLEFTTILVRYLGGMLSALALRLGYLWCAWDSKKQTWHDKMAGTIVVEKRQVGLGWIVALFISAMLLASGYNVYSFIRGFQQGKLWGEQLQNEDRQVESTTDDALSTSPELQALLDKSSGLFVQVRSAGTEKEQALLNDQNIAVLQEATKLAPTDAQVWAQLSRAYTWSSSKGTAKDGLAAATKALELSPNDAGYMSMVGRFQVLTGKNQDAVLQLEKSVRADGTNPESHYWLGIGYYNLEILDKAREHLNKAITIYEKDNQQGDHDERILMIRSELAKIQ